MNAFLSFKPSRTSVQSDNIPNKNTVKPGISSKGAGKAFLVKMKNKMLQQTSKMY